MNDILTIVVAGIFSYIILDILGYLLKLIGIPEPYFLIRHSSTVLPCLNDLDDLHNDINNL